MHAVFVQRAGEIYDSFYCTQVSTRMQRRLMMNEDERKYWDKICQVYEDMMLGALFMREDAIEHALERDYMK